MLSRHKRHSVARDVWGWVGWEYLNNLLSFFNKPWQKALFIMTFFTGCRISEALAIEGRMFDFETYKPFIVVNQVPVLKRYVKKQVIVETRPSLVGVPESHKHLWRYSPKDNLYWRKKYVTEKVPYFRNVIIPDLLKPNQYSVKMLEYLRDYVSQRPGTVIPHTATAFYITMSRIAVPPCSKTSVPDRLYPHWLRAQRAAQLRMEWHLDYLQLQDWFAWKDPSTISRYAKMGTEALIDMFKVKMVK